MSHPGGPIFDVIADAVDRSSQLHPNTRADVIVEAIHAAGWRLIEDVDE